MIRVVFLIISVFSITSFATQIPMVDVVAEAQPESTGYIDLDVSDDSNFMSLIFRDDTESQTATIKELNKKKVTIIKKGPVDIVSVSAKSSSANSMILNVHYLYQYKIFGSIYKVKQLKMYYVAPSNLYETVDVDTNKVITHAYAFSNIIGGDVKGISRIETW